MKERYLQTCFQNKMKHNLFDGYSVKVEIKENPYEISPETLFAMAGRKNLKRGFLFVSKVLGKHIPTIPAISVLFGMLLGMRYYKQMGNENCFGEEKIVELIKKYSELDINEENFKGNLSKNRVKEISKEAYKLYSEIRKNRIKLKEKTLFIGFAETATALGNSVYELFDGEIGYIHTTREYIKNMKSSIFFEEEHSHATEHFIYGDISEYEKIVFIDDELTTGNTIVNFIKEIRKITGIKKYATLSLLDWRNNDKFKTISEEEGIEIESAYILKGEIATEGAIPEIGEILKRDEMKCNKSKIFKLYLNSNLFELNSLSSVNSDGVVNNNKYLEDTGRFLTISQNDESVTKIRDILKQNFIKGDNSETVLFWGSGEFMFIPMKCAMGFENVLFQSTTRSPVFAVNKKEYGVKSNIEFENPYDKNIINYFYNVNKDVYNKAFIFFERDTEEKEFHSMVKALEKTEIPEIYIVILVNKRNLGADLFNVQEYRA